MSAHAHSSVHDHHGHDHANGHHDHAAGASARALTIALALTALVLLAELAGAWAFNSLALLSDAAHMMTDVAALVIALLAVRIGAKAADERRTFGYKRLEILAAAVNALLLFVAAGYVFVAAIGRLRAPEPVASGGVIAIAALGLGANLAAMRVLAAGRGESMAMRGAYLEVWADAIGSLGVIAGAVAIRLTGALWIDPLVAVAIALWILPRTWSLLSDTINVLLEGVPRRVDIGAVRSGIGAVAGVEDVHDLHIWSMSTAEVNATVHVTMLPGADGETVRRAVAHLLEHEFAIGHATIQVEREACGQAAHR